MSTSKNLLSLESLFRAHAERISLFIQEEGVLFRPYSKSSLPYFARLTPEEQSEVVENISNYDEICKEVKGEGGSLKNNQLLLTKALQKFGWTVRAHDLAKFNDEHLLEIYNLSHTQVFRSFRFFEISSYTLEDIYCRKWYHLYHRDEADQQYMLHQATRFIEQKEPVAMPLETRAQRIQELDTLERLTSYSKLEWLIPVFKGDTMVGIMTILKCFYENPDS